jgi:hypothetical protein
VLLGDAVDIASIEEDVPGVVDGDDDAIRVGVGEDLACNLVTLALLASKLRDHDASVGNVVIDVRSGEALSCKTRHVSPLDVIRVDAIGLLEGPEHSRVGAGDLDHLSRSKRRMRRV